MYTFDSRVRYSEIGEDKKLTLNSLLNYFQDCTTFHSASLGRGMDVLEASGHAWVLASWQVDVRRYPGMGEKIRVCTWPYDFKGFCGGRNFKLLSRDGEVLAWANSLWTFLDMKRGVPARILPEEAAAYEIEPKMEMEYAPRKIPISADAVRMESFTVRQHHLDTNHHVNNAQYIRFAQDYIPADCTISRMRAEYKKQALLGNIMIPYISMADEVYTVSLCDGDNKPYAVVEFTAAV